MRSLLPFPLPLPALARPPSRAPLQGKRVYEARGEKLSIHLSSFFQERLKGAAAVGRLHGVVAPYVRPLHEHVRYGGLQ